MRRLLLAAAALTALSGAATSGSALAQENALPKQNWSFDGIFGTFDRASAQRGFQVYQEVCSNCHSLKQAYYRNLEGIGFSPAQVKAIAASVQISGSTDDSGNPIERPGQPSDHFKSPFANDKAARAANNGALPPDQSVLVKAREGGSDYIFDLLNGYTDAPPGVKLADGMNYNKYFPGHQIAMPQPLRDGQVTYADGTRNSLEQEARDVTMFLTYIANPEMEQRKRIGIRVVLFLIMMTCVTYVAKRRLWADVH